MMRIRTLSVSLSIALLTHTLCAQPTVSSVVPGAAQPGKTIDLTLSGAKLDDPLHVWTSFPAKIEVVPGEANKKDLTTRICKVTLDASAPVGIGGLIVGTATGASDVYFFMVDDLDSLADNGNNHSTPMAQSVALPIAIDGASDGSKFDYYKFSAKAGQRLSAEVVAARMGSPFDAVLRLLDATGRELLLVDDDGSYGADCRFSIVAPADGEYVVELRDNKYGGGRYRLRLGDFPLVSVPYPLGARFGSMARVGFTGPASEGAAPLFVKVPEQVPSGQVLVNARFPGGKTAAMATLTVSSLSELLETEPNSAAATATQVTIPCAVNGGMQIAKDQDFFQFAGTKGQAVVFRAKSRSLGSPSLMTMRLLNAEGGQLAETAVNDSDEFTLAYTFPADGMYCLLVEDLLHRGGPEHGYRVEIAINEGFSLSLKNDPKTLLKFSTPVGNGAFAVDVQVARSGYDGPISLSLEGASTGFRLFNSEIPAKAAAHRFIVAVPANPQFKPGDLEILRVIGKPVTSERSDASVVSTNALLKTRIPIVAYPPSWFDGLLSLAVAPELPVFFQANPAQETLFFPKTLGQAQLVVNLERKNAEFKDPITVMIEGLPAGTTYAVKPDKDQYQVTITGPKDLAESRHTVRLVSYGEFKGQGQIAVRELPLEIVVPLAATATPAGPIVAGQKQKVKIVVVRKGADRQPIVLKWKKLPPGVTGDAQIMLTAEQNDVEVELTAAADAAAISYPELTLEVATKYAAQDLVVDSAVATLEVKRP